MRRYLSFLFLSSLSIAAFSQLSQGGTPRSFEIQSLKTTSTINNYNLQELDINEEKSYDNENDIDNRYAVYENVAIDLLDEATTTEVTGGKLYRYTLSGENAYSIAIIFSSFNIPVGADLYIYSSDTTTIYGAFTSANNRDGILAIADLPGNELTIEYYEPETTYTKTELVIGKVGQAYKQLDGAIVESTSDELIDVNCPQGDKYRQEKNAVARYTFVNDDDNLGYLCSGSLINNANNDGKPYFLTANHCISSDDEAESIVAYFNYEAESCGASAELSTHTLSGSSLIANTSASDATLLLFDNEPPASYAPYFPGFDASLDSDANMGIGIHHPQGVQKKISLDYDSIATYPYEVSWDEGPTTDSNTHWLVEFDDGYTQGGSSGSPLFNDAKRIVGQLHGGGDNYDLYGILSVSWETIGEFLDPNNETNGILDGYYADNIAPEAMFYTDITTPCTDGIVKLIDASSFGPTSWRWTISPSSYSYENGTDSLSSEPELIFYDTVSYSIKLVVSNSAGSDSLEREDYIEATDSLLDIIISISPDTAICPASFTSLRLEGEGASSFIWSFSDPDSILVYDTNYLDSSKIYLYVKDIGDVTAESDFTVNLVGSHGSCLSTTKQNFTFNFPDNDDIENAIELSLGDNGPFTNECATVEDNEPSPETGDCNSQTKWCYTGSTTLENTVWFKFTAPESGIVGLSARGFDDQIALYEADSAKDIMSGNSSNYTLIAANDDYYGEDHDYSAIITAAEVTPGETYWLQVDGSAGGLEGDFYVKLTDEEFVGVSESTVSDGDQEILLYPNPVSESTLSFSNNIEDGEVTVKIVSIVGKTETISDLGYLNTGSTSEIYLPGGMENGLHIAVVTINGSSYYSKIVVNRF